MSKWLIGLGGVLLTLALFILGRDGRQQRRAEGERDTLLRDEFEGNADKAKKENDNATAAKARAKLAAEVIQSRLEGVKVNDPDMADLLDAWRS